MIRCPKCAHINHQDECARCGILISKYRQRPFERRRDPSQDAGIDLRDDSQLPAIEKLKRFWIQLDSRTVIGSLAIIAVLYGSIDAWRERAIPQPPGILISDEPSQTLLPAEARAMIHKKEVLQPLADYVIRARVLHKQRYRLDAVADLSPLDLCVSWGQLSDSSLLDQIEISQSGRFCWYRWSGNEPVEKSVIESSIANIHTIPATDAVFADLKRLRPGDVVTLRGQLVRVDKRDGSEWKSSLTRTDTGAGACEIMYVRSVVRESVPLKALQ